ncbi:MAG: hypothetical protein H9917_00635 [Candidatus Oceanisphaera merdipullorum]|nr:hypothetical protein [Candidatus Oceanisphaera merdipullorum]
MTEVTTFSNLVEEAFIRPLRSVLIIDDQYPTWEEILNNSKTEEHRLHDIHGRSMEKTWHLQPDKPLSVIQQFRARKPGLVVDIHDALAPDAEGSQGLGETASQLADHLHQSDLLILDYNLEGDSSGLGGLKARSILQSVLQNPHFNLVIVHTEEDDLEKVFFDCLIPLMKTCTSEFSTELNQKLDSLDGILDDMETEEKFDRAQLNDILSLAEYVELRHPSLTIAKLTADYMKSQGVAANLSKFAQELGFKGGELKNFLFWAIREFEKSQLPIESKKVFNGLNWFNSVSCKWLRTSRGFVTFVKKGPADLISELQTAIEHWQPTPSRLLSAKYRHELSRSGVETEDRSLSKTHVFAHFYQDIFKTDAGAQTKRVRAIKFKEHLSEHTESMLFHIEDLLVKFGEKIISADINPNEGFSKHYNVDLDDIGEHQKAIAHYNSYISTLPVKRGSDQLDSGHIFKVRDEWWICATPACDLQPGQNTIAFVGVSDGLRPFMALKLEVVKLKNLTPSHINSGNYCFVEDKPNNVISLGLRALEAEQEPTNEKATWRTFLAKNDGQIEDGTFSLVKPTFDGECLELPEFEATIFTKLRYEYALNYIRKIGASVSRIGLGYAAFRD